MNTDDLSSEQDLPILSRTQIKAGFLRVLRASVVNALISISAPDFRASLLKSTDQVSFFAA